MKHLRLSSLLFALCSFSFIRAAAEPDTQIVDAISQKQQEELLQQAKTLNEKVSFTQVNSCQSMESVFTDFLELYKKYYPEQSYPRYYNGWEGFMLDATAAMPIQVVNDTVETPPV
jgi:hypothetical protein